MLGSTARRDVRRGGLYAAILLLFTAGPAAAQEKPPEPPPAKPDDLGERLIRKATSEAKEDLMESILRLMGDAARKVEIEFDPGPETQELQRTIGAKLDEAIKAAAARQRPRQSAPPPDSDRRRMPTVKRDTPPSKSARPEQGAASESASTSATSQQARTAENEADELRDVRRGWGHLPQRQRDEIIQGVGESSLERFRDWVERYYRSLQEKDE